MTARIWLVRHGETAGQSSVRYHGKNDVPLSDLGRVQVRALVPWLRALQPVAVVHSPLARAAESAAILAEGCGFAPSLLRVDAALSEISFGDCEGLTAAEIAAAHPQFWAEHQFGRADAFPGGESKVAFGARVGAAITALAAAHVRGDLLVVAHRGTVRVALRTLLAVAPGECDHYSVELGSLSVVAGGSGSWQLERFGELPPGHPRA